MNTESNTTAIVAAGRANIVYPQLPNRRLRAVRPRSGPRLRAAPTRLKSNRRRFRWPRPEPAGLHPRQSIRHCFPRALIAASGAARTAQRSV